MSDLIDSLLGRASYAWASALCRRKGHDWTDAQDWPDIPEADGCRQCKRCQIMDYPNWPKP